MTTTPRPIAPGLFTVAAAGPHLRAARCDACHRLHFPATASCPYCGHAVCSVHDVGATGTLFLGTAVVSRPPGYRGPVPFGFGVVELPEGLRVVTRLTESDASALRPGMRVRLVVDPLFSDEDGTPVLSYAYAPEPA